MMIGFLLREELTERQQAAHAETIPPSIRCLPKPAIRMLVQKSIAVRTAAHRLTKAVK